MIAVLNISLPIFALIGLGYAVTARGVFSPRDIATLSRYVIFIALPALLFNAVATMPVADLFVPEYFVAVLITLLGGFALARLWFSWRGLSRSRKAVAVMGASCPNTASFVYPVILLAEPAIALPVLAMNMIAEHLTVVTGSMVAIELVKDRPRGTLPGFLGRILWSILRRPMIIAICLGLAVSLIKIPVPDMLTRGMDILGRGMAGVMLFVVGGSLVGLNVSGDRLTALQVAIGKIFLGPMLAVGVLWAFPAMGFAPVDPRWAFAVVLTAGAPMFGIFPLLAQEVGHEKMAAYALVLAVLGAFFTLPVILAVMGQTI